jgi:hypothetical protein
MTLTSIRAGLDGPGYSKLTRGVFPHSLAAANHLYRRSITGLIQPQLIAYLAHSHPQSAQFSNLQIQLVINGRRQGFCLSRHGPLFAPVRAFAFWATQLTLCSIQVTLKNYPDELTRFPVLVVSQILQISF